MKEVKEVKRRKERCEAEGGCKCGGECLFGLAAGVCKIKPVREAATGAGGSSGEQSSL